MNSEPKQLLERYLAGSLSEDEMGQFIDALRADPEFLGAARDSVAIHGDLSELHCGDRDCAGLLNALEGTLVLDASSLAFEDALVAEIGARRRRKGRLGWLLAAAAAFVVGIVVISAMNQTREPTIVEAPATVGPPTVMELIARDSAIWGPAETSHPIGHGFVSGTYELRSGQVALQTAGGSLVVVRGPAAFELAAGEQLRLFRGEVGVRVQPGSAFRVRSPGLRIIDLGTEFAVRVEDVTKETALFVFEGAVGVFRELEGESASVQKDGLRVVAGTGAKYRPETGGLESAPGNGEGFLRASRARSRMGIGDYGRLVIGQEPSRFWRFEDALNGLVLCSAGGDAMQLDHGTDLREYPGNRTLTFPHRTESTGWAGLLADGRVLDERAVEPSFAVSFWFRAAGVTGNHQILLGLVAPEVLAGRSGGLQPVFASVELTRERCKSGTFRMRTLYRATPGVSGGAEMLSVDTFDEQEWHHVVYCVKPSKISLWMNGVESVSATTDTTRGEIPDAVRVILGHRSAKSKDQRFFFGEVDEVALFADGIDDDEIREQYRVGKQMFMNGDRYE